MRSADICRHVREGGSDGRGALQQCQKLKPGACSAIQHGCTSRLSDRPELMSGGAGASCGSGLHRLRSPLPTIRSASAFARECEPAGSFRSAQAFVGSSFGSSARSTAAASISSFVRLSSFNRWRSAERRQVQVCRNPPSHLLNDSAVAPSEREAASSVLADGGRGTAVSRERFPRASPKRDSKEDLFSRFQTVFGNVVAAPRIRSVSRAGVRGAMMYIQLECTGT